MIARLEPVQRRYREVTAEPGYLDSVLKRGRDRVLPISEDTMQKTKRAMGLYSVAKN